MNNDILKCVYCNERDNETDDHVPPKSFYPKPRPSNLITVPSCLLCNQGLGKDEEFFLATFMFSHAGVSDAGKKLWAQKLRRTYEKNTGLKRKIAENLSYSDLTTPAGIFLGRGMTINIDEKRFENVVNKILKGLYYFEYKETLSNDTIIRTLFLNDDDRFNAAKANIKDLKTGSKSWEGIFEYKFNRLANSSSCSIWLFRFWGHACFWSVTYDEEIRNKINIKSQQEQSSRSLRSG
jgi:hypothetical protein